MPDEEEDDIRVQAKFYLTARMHDKLRTAAAQEGVTMSQMVTRLIATHLPAHVGSAGPIPHVQV
jgi:hypothetical protein